MHTYAFCRLIVLSWQLLTEIRLFDSQLEEDELISHYGEFQRIASETNKSIYTFRQWPTMRCSVSDDATVTDTRRFLSCPFSACLRIRCCSDYFKASQFLAGSMSRRIPGVVVKTCHLEFVSSLGSGMTIYRCSSLGVEGVVDRGRTSRDSTLCDRGILCFMAALLFGASTVGYEILPYRHQDASNFAAKHGVGLSIAESCVVIAAPAREVEGVTLLNSDAKFAPIPPNVDILLFSDFSWAQQGLTKPQR